MKASCKTCPFRIENGNQRDPGLAAAVTQRTLFNSQQVCHGTEGKNREANHRCRGSFDTNKAIYERIGKGYLISEEPKTMQERIEEFKKHK